MNREISDNIILAPVAPWIVGLGLGVALLSLLLNGVRPAATWADWLTPLIMITGGIVGWMLVKRGQYKAGVSLFAGSVWLTVTLYIVAVEQGIFNEAFIFLLVPILIVGTFISWVGGLVLTLFSIAFVLGVSTAVLPSPTSLDPYRASLSYILLYLIGLSTSYVITLSTQRTTQAFKTAEQKRQQSDAKYKQLTDISPVGIFQLDWRGECNFVNHRWCEISGFTAEQVMGHGWHDALHPNDRERIIRQATHYHRQPDGTLFTERFRYQRPDGETVWVIGNVSVERDEHGRVRTYIGTITDITKEENALRQLRQREQIYSYLVNTVADGVSIADADNRFTYVNDQHCHIMGYTREELIGFEVKERLNLDPANEQRIEAERQKRRRGERTQYELSWINGRGQPVTALINAGSLNDEQGNFTGTLSIITDITQRKQAELALQKSEQLYRNLVETMFEAVAIQDAHGNHIYCNDQHCHLLGATREEIMGKTPHNLLHFDQTQLRLLEEQKKLRQKGIESRYELHFTRRDGVEKTVIVSARPLFEEGQRIGAIVISHDITERVRTEQALRQTQKLESLGVLAGGVAHDFNNLLVAMLGQSSLALHKLDKGQPVHAQLEKIRIAAERAADLTKQLLAYSGHGHFQVRLLNLNQMIEENLHLFAVAMPPHITLVPDLEAELPLIEADASQIQQIIMNLIINGAEACPPPPQAEAHGRVTVSTRTKWLQPNELNEIQKQPRFAMNRLPPGQYVSLQVQDNGSGMHHETVNKIFDPFFTTKPTGRGLGLAAVLGIVRGHRGEMLVQSQPSEGTTFEVLFPVPQQEAPDQPLANSHFDSFDLVQSGAKLPRAVLIIDDELSVREAARDILQEAGVTVLTAPDGETGLAVFQENKDGVDLVLLDLTMPGLHGEETLYALRQLNPDLRVIISSGYNQVDLSQQLLQHRYTIFLPKPYSAAALIHAIHEMG